MLLRLAPRRLRDKHGAEMEAMFRDRLAEARRAAEWPRPRLVPRDRRHRRFNSPQLLQFTGAGADASAFLEKGARS